jgi:excisionase family DNA binding protein
MSDPHPPHRHLLTSAEVARAFHVGVSTVKRWTDEREMEAVRTPGSHRRYTLESLHRFAATRGLPADALPTAPLRQEPAVTKDVAITLYEALIRGDAATVRHLVTPLTNDLAQRAAFLDRVVGDAMREIGDRWKCGDLSVAEEHRGSYLLSEAIDALRPAEGDGGTVILACPPGEQHELPLRLVRLIAGWCGRRTDYLGADVPWTALRHAIDRGARLVALSARSADPFNAEFDEIVSHAHARGAHVVVGGEWARGGIVHDDRYVRFRTLRGFVRWLQSQRSA